MSSGTPQRKRQRLILIIAVLASTVSFLDGSVITVALPAITGELGGGLSTQQWVSDAYLITLGALILVAGSLSDLFGRIAVLRWGLVLFGAASLACAVAPSAELLVVSRAVQGAGGALLVPSSLALILSTFHGAAQAKAIGQWTAATSGALIAGPILGGVFVDFLSWRWVFAINLPIIAVTLVLLFRLAQKDVRQPGVPVDYPGAVLAVLGLGLPVFALIEFQNFGWGHPLIWGSLSLGLLMLAAFVWRERSARAPMVPLALFRVGNFAVGNLATTLIYGALSLGGFTVAVFLQQVGGYPAALAGLAMLPVTIISLLASSLVGGLAARHGERLFMTVGPIIGGLGFLWYLFMDESPVYWTQVLPGVILFGVGLTITVAPLTSAVLGAIDEQRAGIASAINNAVARVAGLVAIAMLGVIVGPELDVAGFHRTVIVTAALLFLGGIVSGIGIRNPKRSEPAALTPASAE